ncbi:MAG TPA: PEP-CTERM sorting domain-containing protein [Verrucomicrobiae bacterium]|nr:PEP-CTERM sorting domain-containing protein [Verrucomicrobiae bacterium]
MVCPVLADYIDLPVKWSQPITDVNSDGIIDGVLVSSDHTVVGVKADDFTSDGRPIVAVRWWGGYISDLVPRPNGYTGPFDISFHLSAAAHPNSVPVDPYLVLYENLTAQEVFVGTNQFGMFVYRYDAYLPTPFHETAGVEYFIDIDKPTNETWGWQTIDISLSPIQDWAANTGGNHVGPWGHIPDDLAFELLVPEPSALMLAGLGLVGLLTLIRRKRA